jgi:DNA-binding transcriptional LysR family regulator
VEVSQIQYFVALCSEHNFTRAARRCGVSQPSLSNGIKALERELGPLFERSPMALTPLGRRVRPHFENATLSIECVRKTAANSQRRRLRRAPTGSPLQQRFLVQVTSDVQKRPAMPQPNFTASAESQ